MKIFLVGSKGKIGKKIKNLFLDENLINKVKLEILDRPPYDIKKYGLNKKEHKIILISIYTKNIGSYIKTIYEISNLFSSYEKVIFIDLCSILQLASLIEIIRYPKYLFYYLNRSIQSIIFTMYFKLFKNKSILKIFFGKIDIDQKKKLSLSTISDSFFYETLKNIILNKKFLNKANFSQNIILCNLESKYKNNKRNIDKLLDKIIRRNKLNPKFRIIS